MRVFELAKQVGVTSKELQQELAKMGVKVKNHMSALEDAQVEAVTRKYKAQPAQSSSSTPARKTENKTKRAAGPASTATTTPKRSHLLIKKRAVEEKSAEEELVSSPAGIEEKLKVDKEKKSTLEEVQPSIQAEDRAEEKQDAALTAPAAMAGPGTVEEKPEEATEKKVEEKKKEEPVQLWKLEKKESPFKTKEKVKKVKKSKVGPEGETFDFKQELSRMQDFRPFHRREDRRSAARRSHSSSMMEVTKPRKKDVKLSPGLTVKDFAELIGQKPSVVIGKLMEKGLMCTINQPIDLQVAAQIADYYGLPTEVVLEKTEEELIPEVQDTPGDLVIRPPVVTIMGHVDHGKTSLLDAIRQTRVTDTEAGGITQHIGAYTVHLKDKRITFLDTPGHEAFTAMRARGAQVTDIVVLVVAADDGVMPQTVEAINHAKAANVPIIVAINKIDKPEANAERIRNSLAEQGLIPEAWGGQTIYVEVSAKKKLGIDMMLEMILLQAEVLELKANSDKPARGVIVEAKLDRGRGPVATVLVQEGTLRMGDAFITGFYSGKVRALIDDLGNRVEEVGPSTPVEVIGLEGVPQAGDTFVVTKDERLAKDIASNRLQKQRLLETAQLQKVSLDDIYRRIKEGEVKELNMILKGDVQGSIEAIKDSLGKIKSEAVKVKIIHTGVGGITESDVLLASASNAIIIGFNVRPEPKGQALAEREKVDIRLYTVIYDAMGDIRAAMEGLLEPTLKEKVLGHAEVRQVFNIPKVGTVAGCYVKDGVAARNAAGTRVLRDSVVIYDGKIGSLKRFKDDVKEVQTGFECGINVENFNDIKPGDIIEFYAIEKIAAKL